jgi:hypothetical protein
VKGRRKRKWNFVCLSLHTLSDSDTDTVTARSLVPLRSYLCYYAFFFFFIAATSSSSIYIRILFRYYVFSIKKENKSTLKNSGHALHHMSSFSSTFTHAFLTFLRFTYLIRIWIQCGKIIYFVMKRIVRLILSLCQNIPCKYIIFHFLFLFLFFIM